MSANIGEGHATAARALKSRLERGGEHSAKIVDGPAHMGRVVHHQIECAYETQLRKRPKTYGRSYALIMRFGPTRLLAQRLLQLFAMRPMRRMVAAEAPDAIVSVYPGATSLLGRLRRSGRLECPLYAAVIDIAGLHFWAHPGVDTHLVVHPQSIDGVERIARSKSAVLVAPLVSEEFYAAQDREALRAALDVHGDQSLVVVSGGGWGVGDLSGAVREVLSTDPDAAVEVVCGRCATVHDELAEEFADDPRVRVRGFAERMWELLGAADLLVHSTGGVTVVEARLAGCPSISYGLPVGHIIDNMRALDAAELTTMAVDREALATALQAKLHGGREPVAPWPAAVDAAAVVEEARPRAQQPQPALPGLARRFGTRFAVLNAAAVLTLSIVGIGAAPKSPVKFRQVASRVTVIAPARHAVKRIDRLIDPDGHGHGHGQKKVGA